MPFETFSDNFNRADGAVGNLWTPAEAIYDPGATINGNMLRLSGGGTTQWVQQRVLVRPTDEPVAVQRMRFRFVSGDPATQRVSGWIKVNQTAHKGIRVYVTGGLFRFAKVIFMGSGAVSTAFKGTSNAATLVNGNTYVMEVKADDTSYTATIYESDGVTVVSTASWTDADADLLEFTGAHPCGVSCQDQTDFDDFFVYNDGTDTFSAAASLHNATMRLTKGADEGFRHTFTIVKVGTPADINTVTVSQLPANVTNPSNTAPGAGTFGFADILAGSGATEDLVGTNIRISLFNGTDYYVLKPLITVHDNERAADIAQGVIVGTSSTNGAITDGGLNTLLIANHGGANAKGTTLISNGTYNRSLPGSNINHWKKGGVTDDEANGAINTCVLNGMREIFGQPFFSSNVATPFSGLAADVDATIAYWLAQGINVHWLVLCPRFDGLTALTTSTINSVAGTTIGVAGYTFTSADVNRWLIVEHTTGAAMYRKITAVNDGTDQCTVERAFTVFPAEVDMACKVMPGTHANRIRDDYNVEMAKRAHDSGEAEALANATMGTRFTWTTHINGVSILETMEDYLHWVDLTHPGDTTGSSDPGFTKYAEQLDGLYKKLTLDNAVFDLTPDTDTITAGGTSQLAVADPTGFDALGWTGGFPGNLLGYTSTKTSGPGSFPDDDSFLYTADGGAGTAVCRVALTNYLGKYDESTITVAGADTTGPAFADASINEDGDTLTLNLADGSNPLLPATDATGISLSGGHSLGAGTRSGNTQFEFPISPVVNEEETLTVSGSGGNITDSLANALQAFSGEAVDNQSTVPAPTGPVTLAEAMQSAVAAWDVLTLVATPSLVGNVVIASPSEAFVMATDNRTALSRVLYSEDAAGVRVTRIERLFQAVYPNGITAPSAFRTALLAAIPNENVVAELSAGNFGRIEASGSVFTVYRPDNRTPMALIEARIENNLSFSVLGVQAL